MMDVLTDNDRRSTLMRLPSTRLGGISSITKNFFDSSRSLRLIKRKLVIGNCLLNSLFLLFRFFFFSYVSAINTKELRLAFIMSAS